MRARGFAALAIVVMGSLAVTGGVWLGDRARAAPDAARAPVSAPAGDAKRMPSVPGRVFLSASEARRGAALGLLPEGVRSVLDIERTLHHGEFRWNDTGVPPGKLSVRVDVDRQLISVFRGGHEIGAAVALYGTALKATPLGRFPIKDKREDYHSRTYDAPMPYSLWLTDDGVAVHGSPVREGRATNGCIGVPLEFARLLFDEAHVGDIVEIVASGHRLGRPGPPAA